MSGALAGLATIDAWVLAAIVAKAIGYAAALLAAGGALFLVVFRRDGTELAPSVRGLTTAAAAIGLLVLALRVGLRAARISGMGLPGMFDPLMVTLVAESPLGLSAALRAVGFALILCLFVPRAGPVLSLAGAVAVASSYALVGHSLGEPRWLLAALLTVHLLGVACWVGALVPLRRAADLPFGGLLLHRFGVIASGAVGLLAAAGAGFAWFLVGSLEGLFGTAYGWSLLLKLALVTGLLGLAALNKLRLVPELAAGEPGAAAALRRSIAFEIALVGLILLATAAMTTLATPPVRL